MRLTYNTLSKLLERSSTVANPIAIFDIDSTLLDTHPRNYAILLAARERYPEIDGAIRRVDPKNLGWNITDALEPYMAVSEELKEKVHRFWKDRFFTNSWVLHDTPYPGASRTVKWITKQAISIIYLTGRDKLNMARGTTDSLETYGFPLGILPNGVFARCLFKPTPGEPDLDFKQRAVEEIRSMGHVVLVVENEPANANVLARSFPEATVLLIDTVTAPDPETLDPGIIRFSEYPSEF